MLSLARTTEMDSLVYCVVYGQGERPYPTHWFRAAVEPMRVTAMMAKNFIVTGI
jgi:hypothetical protein